LAFVARTIGECDHVEGCMYPIALNLAIVFGSYLVVTNTLAFIIPFVTYRMGLLSRGIDHGSKEFQDMPAYEKEFSLLPYNNMEQSIQKYSQTAVLFGYMVLFVAALPVCALVCALGLYLGSKLDAWLILNLYRRPLPQGAQDIGAWHNIIGLLAVIGVSTNAGLVVFTMTLLDGYSIYFRFWTFFLFQGGCFLMQYALMALIPDEPREYAIQLKRTEYIQGKVIRMEADEDGIEEEEEEDVEEASPSAPLFPFSVNATKVFPFGGH